ncbi:hypothetical protein GCK32_021636, partial [Trichostrongylus colubriformis]
MRSPLTMPDVYEALKGAVFESLLKMFTSYDESYKPIMLHSGRLRTENDAYVRLVQRCSNCAVNYLMNKDG